MSDAELRLVLLGRTGAGRRSAVCSILSLRDSDPGEASASLSTKHRGEAAGRQVTVVSSPDWFSPECDPERRQTLISSFIAMSAPGPHAFLLCVPVNQPAEGAIAALDVLEKLFGPSSVSSSTILLFTHMEELDEDEHLEEYLATWRKDLKALVGRCGGRYHTLEPRGGEPEEREAVEEMMVKVEVMAKESGRPYFSCPLYQEAEEEVRKRQEELAKQMRGEGEVTDDDLEEVREEAERSVQKLNLEVESVFPALSVSPPAPSFLLGLWEKMTGWVKLLPKYVRREALLGALVGLFVGGPFGGIIGATVGSVATEVRRRNTQKTK
ncbi:GTPase IMAP family member 7 [Neosynchiropus ocellatus]